MKLRFLSLVAAIALLASCGTTSQTSTSANSAYDAPATLQAMFTTQYPDATAITWSRYDAAGVPIDWELADWRVLTPNDYVVTFNVGNDRYYAWYDQSGTWVGTTYQLVSTNGLPMAINNTLNSQFSGYTIEAAHREMWKDRNAYELRLKNGDSRMKVLIDDNGNIIKQKMKS